MQEKISTIQTVSQGKGRGHHFSSVIPDIFNRESSVVVFSCGVSPPHDEVHLFRQKDPKPLAPGRGPGGAFAPVPISRAAELASLRQSSPPQSLRDRGAATPAGAGNDGQKIDAGFPTSASKEVD